MEIASRAQERRNPSPTTSQTTFIQADTTTFKQLVQTLTGTPKTAKHSTTSIPPIKPGQQKKQSSSKLYERRSTMKRGLMVSPMGQNYVPLGRKEETLSPSILDFPLLALSPVTPLVEYPFGKSPSSFEGNSTAAEEEKAIAEKGFYLHPSPRTSTPKGSEPLLLPLFPVTPPRASDSSY